jgi:hypothetical protein
MAEGNVSGLNSGSVTEIVIAKPGASVSGENEKHDECKGSEVLLFVRIKK